MSRAYTKTPDPERQRGKDQDESSETKTLPILAALVHEIQNELQVITMRLDLLNNSLGGSKCKDIIDGMERVKDNILELNEFFFPRRPEFSEEDLTVILDNAVAELKNSFAKRGIRLQFSRGDSLPTVRIDVRQFRSALQRLLEFSRALLPHGGDIELDAGVEKVKNNQIVKLNLISSSMGPLNIANKNVLQPFLRVNGHRAGLSIVLAEEILRRHNGKLAFEVLDECRGAFSIFIEVS